MKIYCCACQQDVEARLTDGKEIYPHREDLFQLPFWTCDTCRNYVGCHYKTKERTRPLGVIPTPEIRHVRKVLHRTIDKIWNPNGEKQKRTRGALYKFISNRLGYEFHSANVKSVVEAKRVIEIVKDFKPRP